jgi:uncharacterized membrane protein YcaP (DUF421 family)
MDWKSIFSLDVPLFEIILRGSVIYISLFIMLRVVLKRQAGSLGMTDLLSITEEELMSKLREQGLDDAAKVKEAYMEPDGHISVVQRG